MKIRHGFVSNSSSSSFVIVGTYIEASTYYEISDKLQEQQDEKYPLDIVYTDADEIVVGCWCDILNEYTLPQAKEIVTNKIKTLFPNEGINNVALICGETAD